MGDNKITKAEFEFRQQHVDSDGAFSQMTPEEVEASKKLFYGEPMFTWNSSYVMGRPFYMYRDKKGIVRTIQGRMWVLNIKIFFLKLFGVITKDPIKNDA